MSRLYHIFFSSLGFFTKIPIPKSVDFNKVKQGEATLLLPVIGSIVGSFCAGVYVFCQLVLPFSLSVALAMFSGIYITSAFHEDGLADMVDGFGGGWTKERILEIMKDSSIGTYGVLALVLSLGIKYISFMHIPMDIIPVLFITSHVFSRSLAVSLMYDLDYVRIEDSKAKSFTKKMSVFEAFVIIFIGIVSLLFFNNYYVFISIIPIVIVRLYIRRFYKKWIGGYTGDCIGAAQQIFELVFILSVLAVYHTKYLRNIF